MRTSISQPSPNAKPTLKYPFKPKILRCLCPSCEKACPRCGLAPISRKFWLKCTHTTKPVVDKKSTLKEWIADGTMLLVYPCVVLLAAIVIAFFSSSDTTTVTYTKGKALPKVVQTVTCEWKPDSVGNVNP